MTIRVLEISSCAIAFAAVGLTFFDCFMAADFLAPFATSL